MIKQHKEVDMIFCDEDFEDDDYFDPEAEDEESVCLGAWMAGYNAEPYCDWDEKKQWDYDNPDYPWEQAQFDETVYDIPIFDPWREYRDAKSEAEDYENFPSYSDWEDSKNADSDDY